MCRSNRNYLKVSSGLLQVSSLLKSFGRNVENLDAGENLVQSDTPPATTKWYGVALQPGPRRFVKRFGHTSFGRGLASPPLLTEYSRTLFVSLMWIVTKFVLDTLQPHTADVWKAGPATQDLEAGARSSMPVL